jgi:hypothetical protein
MKIKKVANPEDDRMADYRASEIERTKAILEYVAIMADIEIPQEESERDQVAEDE